MKVLFPWVALLILALTATACATAAPTPNPIPTATPQPTPTSTPLVTSTPTPAPTATPLPTATPEPAPTATPKPSLAQRYGISGSPVTVRAFKGLPDWRSASKKRLVVGCYAGSQGSYLGETYYTFTDDGENTPQSDYLAVTGFPGATVGVSDYPCFEMAVWYERTLEHSYWTGICRPVCLVAPPSPLHNPPAHSWKYDTPMLALIDAKAYQGLTKRQWRDLYR